MVSLAVFPRTVCQFSLCKSKNDNGRYAKHRKKCKLAPHMFFQPFIPRK